MQWERDALGEADTEGERQADMQVDTVSQPDIQREREGRGRERESQREGDAVGERKGESQTHRCSGRERGKERDAVGERKREREMQ